MTGNITSFGFTNVPTVTESAAAWTWVLRIDATGGYSLAGTPAVVWVDGSSWSDLDLSANAENLVAFWQVGATTYAALVTNGAVALDPYVIAFPADGTVLVPVARAETIDLGSVSHLGADGTAGTGTLAYTKNGLAASGSTAFAVGDVLGVTRSGGGAASAVSIPRFA